MTPGQTSIGGETPRPGRRSRFVHGTSILALSLAISAGCTRRSSASPPTGGHQTPPPAPAPAPAPAAQPTPPPEAALGLADKGIWSDLDEKVQLVLPPDLTPARITARIDAKHDLLVLAVDGFVRKAYPLGGPAALSVGETTLKLRPGDRAELAPLLTATNTSQAQGPKDHHDHDHDGDGIPDALDVLIGAKKTVINADAYTLAAKDYISMPYPNGDVPRTIGVCTDVVIRAVRNAGIDLQKELHDDIRRARKAYPMVKGSGDPNIDQRRVGTLLPYFQRHWESHSVKVDDPNDPWRPGDVIFMDTFPSRSGPDHVGILSDRVDDQGLPLVVNNWTDGMVTSEMDLLTFVPVLYRFRLPD